MSMYWEDPTHGNIGYFIKINIVLLTIQKKNIVKPILNLMLQTFSENFVYFGLFHEELEEFDEDQRLR